MAKKKEKKENELVFYDIFKTINSYPDCRYYVIYGERTNGKTYSALKYALKNYVEKGETFVYIRRFNVDVKPTNMRRLFANLVAHDEVFNMTDGVWSDVDFFRGEFFLSRPTEDGDIERSPTSFGYIMDLPSMEHYKSLSYPTVTTVIFDEFISRDGYIANEFILFMNCLSTIIRERNNVKVLMLGNTVNKYCPYFEEMGLNHVQKQEAGSIDIYKYGESKLQVLVERTDTHKYNKGKASDIYFAFDNPQLQMITTGEWEIAVYPHLPEHYKSTDVVQTFFIQFNGEILQGEVVITPIDAFVFFHRKTTPIKDMEKDYIYTTSPTPRFNIRAGLFGHSDRLSQIIVSLIRENHVYYGTNEDGEILRNYMQWSQKYNASRGIN